MIVAAQKFSDILFIHPVLLFPYGITPEPQKRVIPGGDMNQQQQTIRLTTELKSLMVDYCCMSDEARISLLVIAEGFAKNCPATLPMPMRFVPKSLRPSVLRFLLFR
jgi:hypothetical protein